MTWRGCASNVRPQAATLWSRCHRAAAVWEVWAHGVLDTEVQSTWRGCASNVRPQSGKCGPTESLTPRSKVPGAGT